MDEVGGSRRQAATDQVLAATRKLVGAEGLDVTMDRIAEVSGVSRRTLFRHFQTRERLITAAIGTGMVRYGEQLPALAPGEDWRTWLRATCDTVHRLNASYGPGYWELTTRADLGPEMTDLERRRRTARRAAMGRIAATMWSAAGGDGLPPPALVAAVGAHLSAHFTAAVLTDVGGRAPEAARLAEQAIVAACEAELRG